MTPGWPAFLLILFISIDAGPLKPDSKQSENRLLESDLVDLPECQRNCARDLAETYGVLLKMGGSHVDRYTTVCQKYFTSIDCISHCPDPVNLFDTLTAGIAYMCSEQNEAFNATMECVDASSVEVQRECDQTCNTQAVMFKWFMEAMHRMSEQGGAAGGGGGLLNIFSGLGGMRAEEGESSPPLVPTDLVLPASVGRIRRDVKPIEGGSIFDRSSSLSSLLGGDKTGLAATGKQANAVLDTVQRSISAFTQPKSSPLFPSTHSSLPTGKSGGVQLASNGMSVFGKPGGETNPLDLSVMRDFTSDACQVSECFLSCVKSKMNARCEGSAGSLLAEVFMRPLARAQEHLSAIPLAGSMFGFILPPQCRFLYDTTRMKDYRMDASLDDDLKRTYREKKEEQAKLDLESIIPTVLSDPISPFDSEESLDDLIAQLYNSESDVRAEVKPQMDTVLYNGPIRRNDRSMDYDGSGEGSGEGSRSGMEMMEGSGEDNEQNLTFEFDAPIDGEMLCVRTAPRA